jgi:Tol biopolymer transport system component
MGEVYRARDPRLGRDVAVKVLHRDLSLTPEHVERLAREARAAGSLNHPNILAVYDVGSEGSVPFIVSELLEGESLRSRLDRGPLPYRKALEYGIQVAEALGAAHEKGVLHRDVKPGNIFITTDGRAKLLDFGLVKLTEGRAGSEDSTAEQTRPGSIHGTPGYMAPEQVLGAAIDQRADIFALGAVLFELLAGVPAFRRSTAPESTRAALSEDPMDGLAGNAHLPAGLVAVVRRCLEKSKEERYQSARDLAFQLRQFQEPAIDPAPSRPGGPRGRRIAALAAIVAGAAVAGWLLRENLWPSAPTFAQLSFRRGRIGGARFASDAGAVVYSEARDGGPLEVWWIGAADSPESRPLGHRGADLLAVRGGKLALSLQRRYVFGERFVGTLAEAPLGEGSPRELVEDVEDADWDPAGTQLTIARSPSVGEESRLEYPPGHTLYKTTGSLRYPRFSRDGRRIAFVEDPTGRASGGRVSVVDLDGRHTQLTDDWPSARGIAWSPAGHEVWFAAGGSRTNRTLRAVNLKGRQRVIHQAPASLTLWDVARDGRILLSHDQERSVLVGVPPGEVKERDLSWFDYSGLADLSEDGQMVLFDDRFGVYIRRTDGSPPFHLGVPDGFGDDFSPDGKKVLATTGSGRQLVVIPSGAGSEPRPLPTHGIATHRGALWFPDGQRILFNGAPPGGRARSYIQDLDGGAPRAVTPENIWTTSISPDGQWLATIQDESEARRSSGARARPPIDLWPVAGGEPRPVLSSHPGDRPVAWTADGRSLWVFRRGEVPAEVSRLEIDTGRRHVWRRLTPPDPAGVYSINDFRVTRGGEAYFYSYKRVLSHLYAVEGLK